MARFRKGTTDHDNDGSMGGSLKAGTRFLKRTMDHDSDGRRGGSLKGEDTMPNNAKAETKAADKPAEKPAEKPAAVKADPTTERLDALEATVKSLKSRLNKAEQRADEVRQVVAPRLRDRGFEV